MNSFKPWLLKNVETRDKSAPNFWDLKHLNSINKFEKSSLAPARVSKSKPTKLFVSELLQKEICGFDRSSLKTSKSEEQEVKEDSRVPVRTIKFKIIFSQRDHFFGKYQISNLEFRVQLTSKNSTNGFLRILTGFQTKFLLSAWRFQKLSRMRWSLSTAKN